MPSRLPFGYPARPHLRCRARLVPVQGLRLRACMFRKWNGADVCTDADEPGRYDSSYGSGSAAISYSGQGRAEVEGARESADVESRAFSADSPD